MILAQSIRTQTPDTGTTHQRNGCATRDCTGSQTLIAPVAAAQTEEGVLQAVGLTYGGSNNQAGSWNSYA